MAEENKIDELSKQLSVLKKDFEDYKINNDKIIKSYHEMLNILMVDYKLQPRGVFKKLQDLHQELLDFVTNICYKYDLEYWLYAGTLLGAVRHDGFIPWDDELDIAMCRKDFDKFLKVLKNEINIHKLNDIILVKRDYLGNIHWIMGYAQLSVYPEKGMYLGHIDIFPYDFVEEINDDIIDLYEEEVRDFHIKLIKGVSRSSLEKDYFEKINVSYDYKKYLIPGIESRRNKFEIYPFVPLESARVFPLNYIEFCGKNYLCPKDNDYCLKVTWEDYMEIPIEIVNHNMLNNLKKIPNINEYYQKYIDIFHNINEKFITKIGTKSSSYVTIPFEYTVSELTNHIVKLKNEKSTYTIYEFVNKNIETIFKEYYKKHENYDVTESTMDINGVSVICLHLIVNGKFIHTNYFYEKNKRTYQIFVKGEFDKRIFKNLINSTNIIL